MPPPLPHPILIILGTRPELIKLAPLIWALREHGQGATVVFGGQHLALVQALAPTLGVGPTWSAPAVTQGTSLAGILGQSVRAFSGAIASHRPGLVVAQGDTVTTLAAALAAGRAQRPFAHIEAGLRSHDLGAPWPEEGYRRILSTLATWHFAPTQEARHNLLAQGVSPDAIWVSGNTVIDTLLGVTPKRPARWPLPPGAPFVLWTLHRRENLAVDRLTEVVEALGQIHATYPDLSLVWPMHPNPAIAHHVGSLTARLERVHVLRPQGYAEFVWAMRHAAMIASDSGGIQEEAPALGVPLLVLRETTERPQALAHGAARLVGTDPGRILDGVSWARARGHIPGQCLYGDGQAARRIARVLCGEEDVEEFNAG